MPAQMTVEQNDLTAFEIQPTGRLLWTPTQDQTVWAAVSRAVRTPTLFEDQRNVTQTPLFPAPGVVVSLGLWRTRTCSPEKC